MKKASWGPLTAPRVMIPAEFPFLLAIFSLPPSPALQIELSLLFWLPLDGTPFVISLLAPNTEKGKKQEEEGRPKLQTEAKTLWPANCNKIR